MTVRHEVQEYEVRRVGDRAGQRYARCPACPAWHLYEERGADRAVFDRLLHLHERGLPDYLHDEHAVEALHRAIEDTLPPGIFPSMDRQDAAVRSLLDHLAAQGWRLDRG